MIALAVLLLVSGIGGASAIPQSAEATIAEVAYEEGVEAYLNGDYESALDAFHRAEESGKTSGELLYNIGNSYFRLNNLGKAMLYYERARLLMPTDELLNHSMRIAQRKTMNRFTSIPTPFWSKYWASAVARLGPGWMFFVGVCFYFTAVVFLGFRIWLNSPNDWLRRGFALSLLAAIPLVAASFKASKDLESQKSAVIIETRVDLRDSPSPAGPVEATAYEGLVVDIVDRSEDWIEIKLPDGTTGWVVGTVLEEV